MCLNTLEYWWRKSFSKIAKKTKIGIFTFFADLQNSPKNVFLSFFLTKTEENQPKEQKKLENGYFANNFHANVHNFSSKINIFELFKKKNWSSNICPPTDFRVIPCQTSKNKKNVTLGRDFQNWYFSWILHLIIRKSLIKRFSLKRLLFGQDHFELNDYFFAKKWSNLQNGPQKCQTMIFVLKRLESSFIRFFEQNLNVFFQNSSHSTADISKRIFLIIFKLCKQLLHIVTIQFQK
jgi:hypothetical protein